MNVVERCIMGPSPQACRCFWSSSGECRWAALIVFKDGAYGTTERWRGGERERWKTREAFGESKA